MPQRLTFDLNGRTALVTGASSGLGRHFARTLATHGAAVALAARRVERLEALASEIRDAGGAAHPVRMDVTDAGSVAAGLDAVRDALGVPDILVNNSGIARPAPTLEVTEEDWAGVVGTNLEGAWRVAQGTARRMVDAGRPGTIINILSIIAFGVARGARDLRRVQGGAAAAHPDHGDGARPPPGTGERDRAGLRADGDEPRVLRERGGRGDDQAHPTAPHRRPVRAGRGAAPARERRLRPT